MVEDNTFVGYAPQNFLDALGHSSSFGRSKPYNTSVGLSLKVSTQGRLIDISYRLALTLVTLSASQENTRMGRR